MRRKIKYIASAILISVFTFSLFSCDDSWKPGPVELYTDFLLDNMSSADSMVYPRSFWTKNVEKTLEVREKMGWKISERDFKYFVLPLRVNNENLDDFRTEWADKLCHRVEGLTMEQAALDINHWCHEMATYQPSDARTSSPLATIRKGTGRCGEESVLAVAALRAVGLPARQVYTPRWAHTDDNHAWVEVLTDDGKWHFMGACEPEPKLDMAWFNAPVSRAMLLHTKVFGKDYDGPEEVIMRTQAYTEINVTGNYVSVAKRIVKVVDESGKPVAGAEVSFKIYNYAEFYTVATYKTDSLGNASLTTGVGDMLVVASKDNLFGVAKASKDSVEIVLDKKIGQNYSFDFDIVPPIEKPIPSSATDEEIAENKKLFDVENELRERRLKFNPAFSALDRYLDDKQKNREAIILSEKIIASLSEKDKNDVTFEVLKDALAHSEIPFDKWRDCPRVEQEFLYPYFMELSLIPEFQDFKSPIDIAKWTEDSIETDSTGNPQSLRIPPVFVKDSRKADPLSKDIFFVALCRARGFSARIDEATGKAQYKQGDEWIDLHTGVKAPQGNLVALNRDKSDPLYYKHFSISKVDGSKAVQLALDENIDIPFSKMFAPSYPLDCGYYMLTTGNRMADGSVLTHIEFFPIEENKTTEVNFVLRKADNKVSVIGAMDPTVLSQAGRGVFLVCCLGYKDEPTTHAVRQLTSIADVINAKGMKVLVLGQAQPQNINGLITGTDKDSKVMKMLMNGCRREGAILPVIALCDSFGRIFYYSQGYNTSLGEELRKVLGSLE